MAEKSTTLTSEEKDPGAKKRSWIGAAADKAMSAVRREANLPEDITTPLDYLKSTRSSVDAPWWDGPNARRMQELEKSYHRNRHDPTHPAPYYRSGPSPRRYDAADDKQRLAELRDTLGQIGQGDWSQVKNLPTFAEMLSPTDPDSYVRTLARDQIDRFDDGLYPGVRGRMQDGWTFDIEDAERAGEKVYGLTPEERNALYLKYRKPRYQEMDASALAQERRARDERKSLEQEAYDARLAAAERAIALEDQAAIWANEPPPGLLPAARMSWEKTGPPEIHDLEISPLLTKPEWK